MTSTLRSTVRSLLKAPGFTAVALLTLALGIGVNTAMFSVVNSLLFRAAPFPEPEQLVSIGTVTRMGEQTAFSEPEIREIRQQVTLLSSLTVYSHAAFAMVEGPGPAERVHGIYFTREMMATLRVQPIAGRTFAPEEFEPGKNRVLLISETFWHGRFGGDPSVIGRTLRLDGETVTVIGVMPARFNYMNLWGNVVAWRPMNFTPDQLRYRAYRSFFLIGRLAPGATPAAVAAQLAPLAAREEKEYPQDYPGLRYQVLRLHEATMDRTDRGISWTLLGLAGFILLIACANLANLQLARATSSVREFAIRAALGASRRQLILHQLTESIVLAIAGGALGLVVALWINGFLERSILIEGVPGMRFPIDVGMLGLTLLCSLVTGVLFGLAPALFASRTDVNTALKAQARGSTGGRGDHRLRRALIIGEVSLALVLLGGATVMNRGFTRMLNRPVGWDTDKIFTGAVSMTESRYNSPEKRLDFYRKLEASVGSLPGVDRVALSTAMPLFDYGSARQIFIDGSAAGHPENPLASHVMVTPTYFEAMGIRLLQGRLFSPQVKPEDRDEVVINEPMARRLWPNDTAVGKRIGIVDNIGNGNEVVWREVIGVVTNAEVAANYREPSTPLTIYRPLVREPWAYVNIVVRSHQPGTMTDAVRRAVATVDPDLVLDQPGTVRQYIDRVQHNFFVIGRMLTGFGALGLILAAVGLYGVVSYLVAQRTLEFGIRLALGAPPVRLLRDVIGFGITLAGIGLAIGLAGAYGLARFLASIMPRVASADAGSLAMATGALFAVVMVACWIPARRATRIDPLQALRAD